MVVRPGSFAVRGVAPSLPRLALGPAAEGLWNEGTPAENTHIIHHFALLCLFASKLGGGVAQGAVAQGLEWLQLFSRRQNFGPQRSGLGLCVGAREVGERVVA